MKSRIFRVLAFACLVAGLFEPTALGQLVKQISDSDTPTPMTPAELSKLGDPLFLFVLRDHSDETDLAKIEQLIQPSARDRHVFVVSEDIIKSARGGFRRAVIAFTGVRFGQLLEPNVMLSVIFNSEDFPEDPTAAGTARLPFIEGWGWDESRGRYNYYRMDETAGQATWKFRGSSVGADALTGVQRQGTCFRCHLNGAPIMKEFLIPWNNWHSADSEIPYLDALQQPANRWPVATHSRLKGDPSGGGLAGAERLDQMLRSAFITFNQKRVKGSVQGSAGSQSVFDAPRLLKPMFMTTEFNMISDSKKSNMHPLSGVQNTKPGEDVTIPPSFFLNADMIAGGGQPGFKGLELAEALRFPGDGVAVISPGEYRDLIINSGMKIDDQSGDADFCWLVPEPSFVDNSLIDELIKSELVPGQYAAAVLAIDLRAPLLSDKRASLLKFVPDTYKLSASGGDRFDTTFFKDHDLTKKTIQALEASSPTLGSVEKEFLSLLKLENGEPREVLRQAVVAYAAELKASLTNQATRNAKLKELLAHAVNLRRDVIKHSLLGSLDETGGKLLFPLTP